MNGSNRCDKCSCVVFCDDSWDENITKKEEECITPGDNTGIIVAILTGVITMVIILTHLN